MMQASVEAVMMQFYVELFPCDFALRPHDQKTVELLNTINVTVNICRKFEFLDGFLFSCLCLEERERQMDCSM